MSQQLREVIAGCDTSYKGRETDKQIREREDQK
jgi:hypothetical protein